MFTKPSTLGMCAGICKQMLAVKENVRSLPENIPRCLSATFPLLVWLIYLVCKTADIQNQIRKLWKEILEIVIQESLVCFYDFSKILSRKRYTLGQSNKIIENDCLKFSFA